MNVVIYANKTGRLVKCYEALLLNGRSTWNLKKPSTQRRLRKRTPDLGSLKTTKNTTTQQKLILPTRNHFLPLGNDEKQTQLFFAVLSTCEKHFDLGSLITLWKNGSKTVLQLEKNHLSTGDCSRALEKIWTPSQCFFSRVQDGKKLFAIAPYEAWPPKRFYRWK